ncbi:hypothetical protein [Flavobacterium cellulosilyticum]|uniref:hypothetical protein n=1 Tax=Flavobacterium cellulosilyticum TaxID=2541731 RepID=UPI001404D644|nr:hypothetical protein [Flavobacterium cellulosilyticum]
MQTAPFVELLAAPSALSKNPVYDIIIDEKVTLQNYCNALVEKIFTLRQSDFPAFINYQSDQVKNTIIWLNKLEKLLANNEEVFILRKALCRYNKLYTLIEKKRTEMQSSSLKDPVSKTPKKFINAESEDRYFSFYEIKKQLEKITDDNQKILLLTKEMFAYQQANIEFINQKTPFYDAQCTKEIENIYALQKIQSAIEKAQIHKTSNQMPFKKMQINCNLNQFIDIHFQFTRELFVDGKPILDGSVNDLVAIVVNSFLDKEGKDISPETVKTILTPSRTEKRPKPHKRIDIDKML